MLIFTYINEESLAVGTPRNFFEVPIELQTFPVRFPGFYINDVNERWRNVIVNSKNTIFPIRWVFVINDCSGNFIWIEHNMRINAFQWSCPIENSVNWRQNLLTMSDKLGASISHSRFVNFSWKVHVAVEHIPVAILYIRKQLVIGWITKYLSHTEPIIFVLV